MKSPIIAGHQYPGVPRDAHVLGCKEVTIPKVGSMNAGIKSFPAEAGRKSSWAICITITVLFFLKFAAFALYITPLWDSPDEPGHYSYALDLSRGDYPILGKARIDRSVVDSWLGSEHHQGYNWIAQHPPLAYAMDAPVVAVARSLGASFDTQVRSARLVSSLIGALSVLGLMAFLTLATGRALLGIAGAVFIGATPMFTQLSGAVTNDILVACTAAWGAYWYARWIRSEAWSHALVCALVVGLGCITKITMLAVAVPLFFAMCYRMLSDNGLRNARASVGRLAVLWLVMFLPVVLWICHNLLQFHSPFPDARILGVYAIKPNQMGFLHFMERYAIWQIILLNFVALIGWMGSLPAKVLTAQADGPVAAFYCAAILCCSLAAIVHAFRAHRQRDLAWPWVAAFALAATAICTTMTKYHYSTITCAVLFVAIVWVGASNGVASRSDRKDAWLIFTSCVFILLFSIVYYHRIWESYRDISHVKALHGRYFYPVLPFFALLMLRPLRRGWLPGAALCVAVAALVVADGFFLHYAFEMYGKY
jgi:4-amino-4-deoxy-L-arabinose transferase-like glycosyltransferase